MIKPFYPEDADQSIRIYCPRCRTPNPRNIEFFSTSWRCNVCGYSADANGGSMRQAKYCLEWPATPEEVDRRAGWSPANYYLRMLFRDTMWDYPESSQPVAAPVIKTQNQNPDNWLVRWYRSLLAGRDKKPIRAQEPTFKQEEGSTTSREPLNEPTQKTQKAPERRRPIP